MADQQENGIEHIPVMASEVEGTLALRPGAIVVDGTLGLGGHASRLAGIVGATGRIIGIDQDEMAIARARERLKDFQGQLDIVNSNFRRIDEVLDRLGVAEVDGILLDLGVSSLQLDDASRGFSFRHDGPLDMRMDRSTPVSAYELVNTLSEEKLVQILWQYGEERFSRRVARAIVQARAAAPIVTTGDLVKVVMQGLPFSHFQGVHPATRAFQAFRIAVNQELDAVSEGMGKSFSRLRIGGRICVIAFHSLEDRIVKDMFREFAGSGLAKVLTKKPLRPSHEEETANSRARSARLRGLERTA